MQPTCLGEPGWQRQSSGASHPPLSGWLGALSWGWGLGTEALETAFAFHPHHGTTGAMGPDRRNARLPPETMASLSFLSVQVHLWSPCGEK